MEKFNGEKKNKTKYLYKQLLGNGVSNFVEEFYYLKCGSSGVHPLKNK